MASEKKQKRRARKKAFFVFLYSLFSKMSFANELKFMNHGYAPVKGDPDFLSLSNEESKFRYSIQLYHHLASLTDWKDKTCVEVSSGNGGGCDYIFRTFKPKKLVGIDLAPASVKRSNMLYGRDGLDFEIGNAQELSLETGSIDIVINVESSLNYPEPEKFIREVFRVLKPGGTFIFADYFRPARLSRIEKELSSCGFSEMRKSNLSKNILRSMALSEPGKQALLKERIPFFCRDIFSQFIFSGRYYEKEKKRFEIGEKTYLSFLMEK